MGYAIFRCVFVAATFSALAHGQVERGAIIGKVTDPSGNPVAKAKVTVTNAETRAKVTTSTTSDGDYAIRNLSTGRYDVEIEAKGLKKSTSEKVQVDTGDGLRLDTQLEYTDISLAVQQGKLIREALERTYQDGGRERHEENGIHACRPGHAMMDVDVYSDTLFCYHISNDASSEESMIDESTEREGLRACPAGWYMRGVHDSQPPEEKSTRKFPWSKRRTPVHDSQQREGKSTVTHEFVLLCSRRSDVMPSGELKVDGGCAGDWNEAHDLLQYPDQYGPSDYWPPAVMTGIAIGTHPTDAEYTLCATTQPIPPGKVVFYHQCADCHDTDGKGVTKETRMFHKIYSRPLGSPEVQAMTNGELQKVFTAKHGGEPKRIKLSAGDIQDLLSYIRTLKQ